MKLNLNTECCLLGLPNRCNPECLDTASVVCQMDWYGPTQELVPILIFRAVPLARDVLATSVQLGFATNGSLLWGPVLLYNLKVSKALS